MGVGQTIVAERREKDRELQGIGSRNLEETEWELDFHFRSHVELGSTMRLCCDK